MLWALTPATKPHHPESIVLSKASENGLAIFKQDWATIANRAFFGDKIDNDKGFFDKLGQDKNSFMPTPAKLVKGEPEALRQYDRAFNGLYSKAVPTARQPIEPLFNWPIEKTDIQRAGKIRSTNGLPVHVFGKIAAAFLIPIFNS